MTATKDSWKVEPFDGGVPVPFRRDFSRDEFIKLQQGLIPEAMEDKWFIFYEAPNLFLHRSWTSLGVYKVILKETSNGAQAVEAHCNPNVMTNWNTDYQAILLDWLIANLLLHEARPYPLPPDSNGADGILQHHVAGTGFTEIPADATSRPKRWWRRRRR